MFEKLSEKFGKVPSAAVYEGKNGTGGASGSGNAGNASGKKGKQLSGKNKKKRVLLIAAGVAVLAARRSVLAQPQRKGENGQRKSWRAEDSCRYSGNPDFGTDFLWHHFSKRYLYHYFSGGGNCADGGF